MPSIQLASIDDPRLQPPLREPWMDRAACLNVPLEKFFPAPGMSVNEGKKICEGCNVSLTCLASILNREGGGSKPRYGVFGGISGNQRDRMVKLLTENPTMTMREARELVKDKRGRKKKDSQESQAL